tara:strand:- start:991 stop:1266 length:276 start_codon:yes stop_codon:yes gene_type:complete
MFDVVSGRDGNGIIFVDSYDNEDGISTEIECDDVVVLYIDGNEVEVEVTDVDGRQISGVVSRVTQSAAGYGVGIDDTVSFRLENIARCIQR